MPKANQAKIGVERFIWCFGKHIRHDVPRLTIAGDNKKCIQAVSHEDHSKVLESLPVPSGWMSEELIEYVALRIAQLYHGKGVFGNKGPGDIILKQD